MVPVAYADFGQRAVALFLDSVISGAASLVIVAVAVLVGLAFGLVNDTLGWITGLVLWTVGYFALIVVFMLMEAGPYGQTPGKHIMGIRVVDLSGRTVSRGLSVARYFSKMLSGLPFYLGYLWPLWDPHRRTFHDMIVNTRVITTTDRAPSLVALVHAPFTGRRS